MESSWQRRAVPCPYIWKDKKAYLSIIWTKNSILHKNLVFFIWIFQKCNYHMYQTITFRFETLTFIMSPMALLLLVSEPQQITPPSAGIHRCHTADWLYIQVQSPEQSVPSSHCIWAFPHGNTRVLVLRYV